MLASIELDLCRGCRGLWFDRAELDSFGKAVTDVTLNEQLLALMRELGGRASRHPNTTTYLACPICHIGTVPTNLAALSGILLHRCAQHGTWVDHEAAVRIVEVLASDGDGSLAEAAAARSERELQYRLERLESSAVSHGDRLNAVELKARIALWLAIYK